MGWIICFALLISYFVMGVRGAANDVYLIMSAIFAVAGSISEIAVQIKKK